MGSFPANSAAALCFPSARYHAVRAGIALYGVAPSDEVPLPDGFCPALAFRTHIVRIATLALLFVLAALFMIPTRPAISQTTYRAPRTADGKPNLNGIWQAMNDADWDIEPHTATAGTVPLLGAIGATPPGMGIVEGGSIPYLPAANPTDCP